MWKVTNVILFKSKNGPGVILTGFKLIFEMLPLISLAMLSMMFKLQSKLLFATFWFLSSVLFCLI